MRVLLFFHGGSENRGCEAIVRTAIKQIRHQYPSAEISLASRKPETDQMIDGLNQVILHNQERGFKRFSKLWFQNFIEQKFLNRRTTVYRLIHKDIIDRIDDFDIILSIGGDNYCYGEIPDYYELNKAIKTKGKKLFLWGASVGKEDVVSEAMKKDLASFDALLIRESNSVQDLESIGFKNIHLIADGAFLLDKEELTLPREWEDGKTIGFNYSPLVFKKHPESRAAALELLKHILKTTDYKIAMTPHVIIENNDDEACMQDLVEDLKTFPGADRIFFLPKDLNACQIKGYIARMRMFVGARTHATIAAYSSGVPTMVLGYSIKSLGIAKDLFGQERLVLKSSEISNADLLIEKFDELDRDQKELKEILEKRIPEIKRMAYKAGEFL